MKIDIGNALIRAKRQADGWSKDGAFAVATSIASQLNAEIDWDRPAGEDWISVMPDRRRSLMVRVDFPLIVKVVDLHFDLEAAIETIEVPDMHENCLTCSQESLDVAFPGIFPESRDWDNDAFAPIDLWAATVC